MPRVNLWVPEDEGELLDRAKALLGEDSLSRVFRECLRREVARRQPADGHWERIQIHWKNHEGKTFAKVFTGRWIIAPGADAGTEQEVAGLTNGVERYGFALTQRGRFALTRHFIPKDYGNEFVDVEVLDSLKDTRPQWFPERLMIRAAEALHDTDYFVEELDI